MNDENLGFSSVPPQQTTGKEKIAPKATYESTSATGVVLDNYRQAKLAHDSTKAKLDECKTAVLSHIQEQISVGTNRFATNHFVLKTVLATKYQVDSADMNALNQALCMVAGMCGNEVAGSLLKWKPTLNVSAYEGLPPEAKKHLEPFITMSYSSPTLTLEDL